MRSGSEAPSVSHLRRLGPFFDPVSQPLRVGLPSSAPAALIQDASIPIPTWTLKPLLLYASQRLYRGKLYFDDVALSCSARNFAASAGRLSASYSSLRSLRAFTSQLTSGSIFFTRIP